MRFPVEGVCGKCIPEFALRVGCGFPIGLQAESVSRSGLGDPVPSVSEGVIFVTDFPIRADLVPFGKMRHAILRMRQSVFALLA